MPSLCSWPGLQTRVWSPNPFAVQNDRDVGRVHSGHSRYVPPPTCSPSYVAKGTSHVSSSNMRMPNEYTSPACRVRVQVTTRRQRCSQRGCKVQNEVCTSRTQVAQAHITHSLRQHTLRVRPSHAPGWSSVSGPPRAPATAGWTCPRPPPPCRRTAGTRHRALQVCRLQGSAIKIRQATIGNLIMTFLIADKAHCDFKYWTLTRVALPIAHTVCESSLWPQPK